MEGESSSFALGREKKSRCQCDEGINIHVRVSSQNAVIALTASLNRLDHHRNYGCQRCLYAASDAHSQSPYSSSSGLSLFPFLTSTLPGPSASEVTTFWRYTNTFIIIFYLCTQFPGNEKNTLCNTKSTKIKLLHKTVMQ